VFTKVLKNSPKKQTQTVFADSLAASAKANRVLIDRGGVVRFGADCNALTVIL
jgi:hypothetical protein